jgi:hypothetical protein
MQQRLKSAAGSARTRVIPTQFFKELFSATHDAIAAFHMSFRRETLSTFATDLESN